MACKMAPSPPRVVVPGLVLPHTTFAALSHPLLRIYTPFSNAFRPSITLDPTPMQQPNFSNAQVARNCCMVLRGHSRSSKASRSSRACRCNLSLPPTRHPTHLLKVLTLSHDDSRIALSLSNSGDEDFSISTSEKHSKFGTTSWTTLIHHSQAHNNAGRREVEISLMP
ncbi:hypothetical protein EDD22DRAFT_971422 [Suillus occidentalis]|nr:hypothetical protein EDD22DRAFT_971422 [Suillus occidentalis]